jgi:uncharacterized membrane protein
MKHKKASIRFRKQLKAELPILQSENLISTEQGQAIAQRYQLDNLASESTSKLLVVIYSIGVFLIGIGIISFVAYHWNAMSKGLKLTIIFAAMLTSHGVGFYLWKVISKSPKFGHALVCLGTLIFGANIGLIAQIFHIKGHWNGLFLPWALGAIIMAYAVSSVPNAAIGIITSFIWFIGQLEWHGGGEVWWYPFAITVLFGGFAYFKRSVLIFTMTLLSLAISLPICLASDKGEVFGATGGMLVIGLLFFCWGLLSRNSHRNKAFTVPAIILGVVSTTIALYLNSFLEFGDEMVSDMFKFFDSESPIIIIGAVTFATAVTMIPFATKQIRDSLALKIITVPMVAAPLLVAGAGFINDVALVTISNILFLVLAMVFIWSARLFEDRRLFWSGVLIAATFVVSRALEYETGLLIKSAVFTACGIGVMIAGVMFEKYLKSRRAYYE